MSGRRSRWQSITSTGGSSRTTTLTTDDQIIELLSKLQQLLPHQIHSTTTTRSNKEAASKVLKETCKYIKKLQKEMDDLSVKLAQLLSTVDADSAEAAVIRALII